MKREIRKYRKHLSGYKVFILNILVLFTLSYCTNKTEWKEPVLTISRANEHQIDGFFEEWTSEQFVKFICDEYGNIPEENDISARMKANWGEKGLFFYFEMKDDTSFYDTIHPWRGDAVEVFISDFKGSPDIVQYSVPVEFDSRGKGRVIINDHRKNRELLKIKPDAFVSGFSSEGKTEFEVYIETGSLGFNPGPEATASMQVYVDDWDSKNDKQKNRMTLFSSNYGGQTSFTHYPVEFSETITSWPEVYTRMYIVDDKKLEFFLTGIKDKEFKIDIIKNKESLFSQNIQNSIALQSIHFSFNSEDLNPEADSLYVYYNDECIGFHNLILAPRKYQEMETPEYHQTMRFFKFEDLYSFAKPNSTLFIGSSSIRMWNSLKDDFPELNIIHRGFGGSNSADVLKYMNEIVLPYNAENIVYYEGDNDIPAKIPPDTIIYNMEQFIIRVRETRPDTKIYLISPKPAIVRMQSWNTYKLLHSKMAGLAESYTDVFFIDVSEEMFHDSRLNEDLFIEDGLHMNDKGYNIWTDKIR